MSEGSDNADLPKRNGGSIKGMVRHLIQRFEQLENTRFSTMGAEQSVLTKLPSTNLVKEKVNQFNQSTGDLPSRVRHKSITEEDDNFKYNRDFQRSKSLDYRKGRTIKISSKLKYDTYKHFTLPKHIVMETKPKVNNQRREGEAFSSALSQMNKTAPSVLKINEDSSENLEQNGCATMQGLSISDKGDAINGDSGNNKPDQVKYLNVDDILTQTQPPIDVSVESYMASNTEELTQPDESLDEFRNDIWTDITNDFLTENQNSVQSEYDEDEYDKIKNSFREMEEDIERMKERFSEITTGNQTTSKSENLEEHLETIDIYLTRRTFSSENLEEDEFGERHFGNLENMSYTEAYNRLGDELVETSVASVKYRTFSEHHYGSEPLLSGLHEKTLINTSLGQSADSLLLDDKNKNKEQELFSKYTSSSECLSSDDGSENKFKVNVKLDDQDYFNSSNHEPIQDVECEHENDNTVENPIDFTHQNVADDKQEETYQVASNRSTIYSSPNSNSTDSIDRLYETTSEEEIDGEYQKGATTEGNTSNEREGITEDSRVLGNNIEIRKQTSAGLDRTIKTETIYDSFQNPRIAKVSNVTPPHNISNNAGFCAATPNSDEPPKSSAGTKSKIEFIIEELVVTERKYLSQLAVVLLDYMPKFADGKLPPLLSGKSQHIFGNIGEIYKGTRRFYALLVISKNDYERIAEAFLKFKYLFELYPLYSKNKPIADQYLLGEFKDVVMVLEKRFRDRLGLSSYLLTPIQRLGKYILFLEQIQKELLKKGCPSDNIYRAIETVRKQMSRGNDYVAIDSIKESPVNLIEQGSFLMREKFNVLKPRKYEATLFLFQKIIVFTTADPRNPEMFIYRDSIKLNEMGIVTFDDQPLTFHLKRFNSYKKPLKKKQKFVVEARRSKDKKLWTEEIEKLLWEQLIKCREEQRRLHWKQEKRPSVAKLPKTSNREEPKYNTLPANPKRQSIFYMETDE